MSQAFGRRAQWARPVGEVIKGAGLEQRLAEQ